MFDNFDELQPKEGFAKSSQVPAWLRMLQLVEKNISLLLEHLVELHCSAWPSGDVSLGAPTVTTGWGGCSALIQPREHNLAGSQ